MFTKDSRTETFLNQMGVSFEYRHVKFSDLAPGWEEHNLARPVPIREDAVMEYGALMESGSPAPAPILWLRDGKLNILDGVQRLAAAQLAKSTTISGYVVECESEDVATSINVLANSRLQGRPEPIEWTRRRAVEVLCVQRGMTHEEVARMGGWRSADVRRTAESIAWRDRVVHAGGPELSDAMLGLLAKHTDAMEVTKAPKPVAAFLHVVKNSRMSAEDAEPLVEEFFSAPPKKNWHKVYAGRLDKIKSRPDVAARIAGRKPAKLPPDVSLQRTLRAAITLLEEIEQSGEPLELVDEFFKLTSTIREKLGRLGPKRPEAEEPRVPADRWS